MTAEIADDAAAAAVERDALVEADKLLHVFHAADRLAKAHVYVCKYAIAIWSGSTPAHSQAPVTVVYVTVRTAVVYGADVVASVPVPVGPPEATGRACLGGSIDVRIEDWNRVNHSHVRQI